MGETALDPVKRMVAGGVTHAEAIKETQLRILHVVWDLNQGGLERLVGEMVKRMKAPGLEFDVVSLGSFGSLATGLDSFARMHLLGRQGKLSILAPLKLARLIRRIEPHVVHVHSGTWFKGAYAARLAGVSRVIFTDHGRLPDASAADLALDRLAVRLTSDIAAVSPWLREFIVSRLGAREDRTHLIRNGVDTDHFSPPMRTLVSENPTALNHVGTIGRLVPVKDQACLINAVAILNRQRTQEDAIRLSILGDGPERRTLEALTRRLNQERHVRFLGWSDDVKSLLGSIAIFALSSLSEGTSLSLLEAMSAGVCPVVTNVGGNPDVLGPELAHRLVPAGDPERLAVALGLALSDDAARSRDALCARERVLAEFSLDTMCRRYAALYAGSISQAP